MQKTILPFIISRCKGCGCEFSQNNRKNTSEWCTRRCYDRVRNKNKIHAMADAPFPKKKVCAVCSVVFETRTRYLKTCDLPACKDAYALARKYPGGKRLCFGCGDEYMAPSKKSKYCSNGCATKYARKNSLAEKGNVSCVVCFQEFTPSPETKFNVCSVECYSVRRSNEWKENCARRRIAINNGRVKGEVVRVHEIFARENYICALCGIKTSKSGGKYANNYPTIDHIIPLSKGGQHIPGNLQCLCRKCNISKGSKNGQAWTAAVADRRA